jgi:hypothetical protein
LLVLVLGLGLVAAAAAPPAAADELRARGPSGPVLRADRHIVARGETLERVARAYGCPTEALLRANRLETTLVPPGTVVVVPPCPRGSSVRARAQLREPADPVDLAQRALAAIDGTARVQRSRSADVEGAEPLASGGRVAAGRAGSAPAAGGAARGGESIGQPWAGALAGGARLAQADGYRVRRPHRAYGASHVVDHVRGAIAAVRALYPHVHTLAIGDLSAPRGGRLGDHQSHQSGLDVDLGLYFTEPPLGYPAAFAPADDTLDLAATWALIHAFARTSHLPAGVEVIFLDRAVQARLYRWAAARGTPIEQLAELLQYPRAADARAGLVRHWPGHADHLHVRFRPEPAASAE